MERLYAPWRTQYITSNKKQITGCVFCHISKTLDDDKNLGVLHRDEDFFIVMNKYPYSPGHFMIIPNYHTANLEDLDPKIYEFNKRKFKELISFISSFHQEGEPLLLLAYELYQIIDYTNYQYINDLKDLKLCVEVENE